VLVLVALEARDRLDPPVHERDQLAIDGAYLCPQAADEVVAHYPYTVDPSRTP